MYRTPANEPQRILAIKLADLGDVLNITPALRALRERYPHARLDVLSNPHTRSLLDGATLLDDVVVFQKTAFEGMSFLRPGAWQPLTKQMRNLHKRRYDTVVNFHHLTTPLGRFKQRTLIKATGAKVIVGLDNGQGGWLTHRVKDDGFGAHREVAYWLALAAALDAKPSSLELHYPADAEDERAAALLLREIGLDQRPYAVLHPGSGGYSLARRWDPGKYAELAERLRLSYGIPSILVGTASDNTAAVQTASSEPIIDISGRTTIRQLAAILKQCRLFVGADSGIMHLAAAAQVPIIAIFGPSNHRAWAPWTPSSPSVVVRTDISCSPCAYVGHKVAWRNGCPERTCLAELTVNQVLFEAARILS